MDWRGIDRGVVEWAYGLGLPTNAVAGVTHLATKGGIWLLLGVAFTVFGRGLTRRTGAALLTGLALHFVLLETFLKNAVARPRPCVTLGIALRDGLVDPATFSFPSGHAAASFLGAWIIGARFPRRRLPLLAVAALTAASRVVLGAHYPTDVLGGAVFGLGVVLVRVFALRARRPTAPDDSARPRSQPEHAAGHAPPR